MVAHSLKAFLPKDKFSTASGFMGCMALWLAFIGVESLTAHKSISETKAVGLSTRISDGPLSLIVHNGPPAKGVIGGRLGGFDTFATAREQADAESIDRKIVRKGTINISVVDPDRVNQQLEKLARELGGYIVTSQREDASSGQGSLVVDARVPAKQFDRAWEEVRKLGVRVDSERVDSSDVTKQFVDTEASLRNLRAEEQQYLTIMKQAKSVKDTLEVTEHLSSVRGQIDRMQGELNLLRHDVEMSSLTVAVLLDADSKVLGIYWRPIYETKVAFRNGLEALTSYVDLMVAFIMYIPALLIWAFTIVLIGATGFRTIRWAFRRLFRSTPAIP
ncbi:MAG: hypothetical protein JWO13_309 [Acidobacteriales bacterium]|nr:hypothetical protein [Terriglobales bacterium]